MQCSLLYSDCCQGRALRLQDWRCQAEDKLNASGFCPRNRVMLSGAQASSLTQSSLAPQLWVLVFNCTSLRGHVLPKGPREICPVHHPTSHENQGSLPNTAECQDWTGLGSFLIHPSSFLIYRNSGSERGVLGHGVPRAGHRAQAAGSPSFSRVVTALPNLTTLTLIA